MIFEEENSLPQDPIASADSSDHSSALGPDADASHQSQSQAFVPGLEPPFPGPYQDEGWRRLRESTNLALGPKGLLPDDLSVPWGWIDLLFLVIFWIGGTLISTIALAIIFSIARD